MLPLQSIAMGLVVIALTARVRGYDALPDPLGWLLVLLGLRGLTGLLERWRPLAALALLAGGTACLLWLPASQGFLDDHDEALRWAANLPQLVFLVLLSHSLAAAALAGHDPTAARWLRTAAVLGIVVAAAPVLVFGGGLAGLEEVSYLTAGLAILLVVWLLFAYARRPWASRSSGV